MVCMVVSDCIDCFLLETCKCTHRADLAVQDTFLISFLIVSLADKRNTKNIKLFNTIWSEHTTVKNS